MYEIGHWTLSLLPEIEENGHVNMNRCINIDYTILFMQTYRSRRKA